VLVPAFPGVLSAFGMAVSPVTKDRVEALIATLTSGPSPASGRGEQRLRRAFERLEAQARREMASEGYDRRVTIERAADLRYEGQSYELTVPVRNRDVERLATAFHRAHERRYGHSDASRAVEIVALRVRASAPGVLPSEGPVLRTKDGANARAEYRSVWFDRERRAAVYERSAISAGARIRGPALVTQLDATTVVPPGWSGVVDGAENMVLERS
jgi:N-methylhydantoinase A